MTSRLEHMIRATKMENEFAYWFTVNRLECGYTCKDVADKLRMAKQTISNQLNGRSKPTYICIMAYCAVFGNKDDPEEIWEMINKEEP